MAYGLLKVIKEIECLLIKKVLTKYTSIFFYNNQEMWQKHNQNSITKHA